jgi:hypothetical protein
MEPISREEAKARGLKRYYTGKPCKHGHITERRVIGKKCRGCQLAFSASTSARWRKANPEHWKQYIKGWRQKYPERVLAWRNRRRALETQAMPSWVRTADLWVFHKECKRLSKETGVKHHVDHIVPLRGEAVCGLHVPWNLRIIPAAENNSKKNIHVYTSGGSTLSLGVTPLKIIEAHFKQIEVPTSCFMQDQNPPPVVVPLCSEVCLSMGIERPSDDRAPSLAIG